MPIPVIQHNAWEPVFAKSSSGLWRLEYCGSGSWEIHQRRHLMRLISWFKVVEGDVNSLSTWARKRKLLNEPKLPRMLGIRMSGSYETRLHHLRESLICIGWMESYNTEGGVGTSFVERVEYTAFAELGDSKGIDVWIRKTVKFSSEEEVLCYESDCTSIEEVTEVLREVGMSLYLTGKEQLIELLKLIDPAEVEVVQTYIPKPKGRGRGSLVSLCSYIYEVCEEWSKWVFIIDDIRDAMRKIKEKNIQIDWEELLEGQSDLCPSVWEEWASCDDCYEHVIGLVNSFPWTHAISGTYWHSNVDEMLECTEFCVYASHEAWLKSCLNFVSQRLLVLVEPYE